MEQLLILKMLHHLTHAGKYVLIFLKREVSTFACRFHTTQKQNSANLHNLIQNTWHTTKSLAILIQMIGNILNGPQNRQNQVFIYDIEKVASPL